MIFVFSYCNASHLDGLNDPEVPNKIKVDIHRSLPNLFHSALLCAGKLIILKKILIPTTDGTFFRKPSDETGILLRRQRRTLDEGKPGGRYGPSNRRRSRQRGELRQRKIPRDLRAARGSRDLRLCFTCNERLSDAMVISMPKTDPAPTLKRKTLRLPAA